MKATLFSSIINTLKNTTDEITLTVHDHQLHLQVSTNELTYDILLTDENFTLRNGRYTMLYHTLHKICKNVRTDTDIRICNSSTNATLLFQIHNDLRTMMYECPCQYLDCRTETTNTVESVLPYLTIKTTELKYICKSFVNTAEKYKIEQFDTGLVISTLDSVLTQSVSLGEVGDECIDTTEITNTVLQRLLRLSLSNSIGFNSEGCLYSVGDSIRCKIQF